MKRWYFFVLVVLGIAHPVLADIPQPNAEPTPLDIALERAAAIAAKDDWKQPGFSDAELDKALAAIIGHLQVITKNKSLKLPVTFAEVQPAKPGVPGIGFQTPGLHAGKRVAIGHARKSIILADEIAEVSFAEDCLIIARGAVRIAHSHNNVVLAGHFIHSSHDGNPRPRNAGENAGSVFLSGGVVDISHATGTTVCAPLMAAISHANIVTFINTPSLNNQKPNSITDDSGILPRTAPQNPLFGKLKITQVVSAGKRSLVTAECDDGEVVIRPNSPLPAALEAAQGWELVFVEDGFALFANGKQLAGEYVAPRP